MINHFRTLLINRDGDEQEQGSRLGDEYLPPNFRAVTLPGYLQSLRRILFGSSPDRVFANYRARQCMSLMHSSELVEFVLHLDPRITYDLTDDELMVSDQFGITTDCPDVSILRELGMPDAIGRSLFQWRVTVLDSNTVSVNRQTPPASSLEHEYAFQDGLSNEIPLHGSEASVVFGTSLTPGQSFSVRGLARPRWSLGEIAAEFAHSGAPYLNNLFGVGTPLGREEPFMTFRNLWNDHPELPYKLGGLLSAMVYQTERLRSTNA